MLKPTYEAITDMINSPVRQIKARVELLNGSTLLNTFTYEDRLIELTIERVGEGKFFGFGICARLNVKLIDRNRELNISTDNTIEVVFGAEENYMYAMPLFKVSEVHRDENTNELSITAYDWLYQAAKHTVDELILPANYSIETFAIHCAALIGLNCRFEGIEVNIDDAYTYYPNGANFDGKETIREALNAVAEATQTIYYVDNEWTLVFKRMDISGNPVLTIDRDKYFTLDSNSNRRLTSLCAANELGDNLSISLNESGTTQYIRDNPFYEMREDIADLLSNALDTIGGFTLNQFECEWRGNYLLEMGDCIALITKDGKTAISYFLDDTITYNGSYSQNTKWAYADNDEETESNPISIGDAIKSTYAKVDKVNRKIELVASETTDNSNRISSLQLNTESIALSVESINNNATSAINSLNDDIADINKKVAATMTANDVKLEIQTGLANGTNKVITSTGFTFDENGLTIDKTGSEVATTITENGMYVNKGDETVLIANNVGVDAVNLHATTYLIVGVNSRFENYGDNRTGCFWINN